MNKALGRELAMHALNIRIDIVKMIAAAGSGHPAGALGLADIYAALFFDVLRFDPRNLDNFWRDHLVISNGHTAPVFYAALAEAGLIDKSELKTLAKFGSRLQGHPERTRDLPLLDTTSGPLGEGLSQAAGMAYALKFWPEVIKDSLPSTQADEDAKFNQSSREVALRGAAPKNVFFDEKKILGADEATVPAGGQSKLENPFIYCIIGDGELDEGANWEAAQFAAKNQLSNLIAIVDRNHIQLSGDTADVMPMEPLADKWQSFGWQVLQCDGNDAESLIDACQIARAETAKPTVIIAYTVPGKGVSFMENDYHWHGRAPDAAETRQALNELEAARL
ncbi:MAG: transketolase [Candidatus Nomurabacteria bacterium]|jgi:transketolase|nr:transketolase [Candidatus Nomurabacteria bacterium]